MAKKTAKKAAKKAAKATNGGEKALTKSQLMNTIAEQTQIARKDVMSVMEALETVIIDHLKPKGPGIFTLPGVCKMKISRRAATPARPGKNPFTGEAITIAAKPARNVLKITPVKAMKEFVATGKK